jgi:hypothetical protein
VERSYEGIYSVGEAAVVCEVEAGGTVIDLSVARHRHW